MHHGFEKSRASLERARQSLAGGVSSPFRAKVPEPLYFQDGQGPRLLDADGNWYIDYTLGWGPNILGYRHPAVVEAVQRAAAGAHTYGAQHELEFLVSEMFQRLVPCAGRVAFTLSGSEACQIVWRLARAFTGRNLIVKFEGHYHGWMDSVLISHHPSGEAAGPDDAPRAVPESRGQVPNAVDNVIVARWNSIEALRTIFERHGSEIAGVVMEPVLCNSGCLMPRPGYLEAVLELTRAHGALLLFDEVITGFRMGTGGAQQHFGVIPDLATFGKALGGGAPLSGFAGRREILDLMIDGGVSFGGSFNGNPISLAGGHAALQELSRNGGEALARANRTGCLLMNAIAEAGKRCGLPLLVSGFGAAFALHFTPRAALHEYRDTLDDDKAMLQRLIRRLLVEGVYILPDGRMYVSTVHGPKEVEETVNAFERALESIA